MEPRQRWISRWRTANGTPKELLFESEQSLMIARLDFQLKLIDLGEHIPDEFTLEDATLLVLPAAPLGKL